MSAAGRQVAALNSDIQVHRAAFVSLGSALRVWARCLHQLRTVLKSGARALHGVRLRGVESLYTALLVVEPDLEPSNGRCVLGAAGYANKQR